MSTPVTVIGGYLGAGKTTLINTLLRQADGHRLAVLVNEFGALSIDEDLILAQEGDVISIAGGCICCTFGDNLVGAFTDLLSLSPPPDHLIIEASGVAIPSSIAATLSLVQGVTLHGTVVLLDAETVQKRARDTYIGDTITRQIETADLLLATKADLVDDGHLDILRDWLGTLTARAALLPVRHGAVPNEVVLGLPARPDTLSVRALEDHGALYSSLTLYQTAPADPHALIRAFEDSHFGTLRAKGHFRNAAQQVMELQGTGVRLTLTPASRDPVALAIVFIGLKTELDKDGITKALSPLNFHPKT